MCQKDSRASQRGGLLWESVRMFHLLEIPCEIAEAIRRAEAKRGRILPGTRIGVKVETCEFYGHCECFFCGDSYLVEPDAFGDGCMTYYVGFLTGQTEADDHA